MGIFGDAWDWTSGTASDAWNSTGGAAWDSLSGTAEDMFSAQNVHRREADIGNYQYGPEAAGNISDIRATRNAVDASYIQNENNAALYGALGARDASQLRAQYGGAADARAGSAMRGADAFGAQGFGMSQRDTGIGSAYDPILGQYSGTGMAAQNAGMGALTSLAGGLTPEQAMADRYSAGLGALGAEQANFGSSVGRLEGYSTGMAGLANGSAAQGQGATAGQLAAMGYGDIAGQQQGIAALEGYANRGPGESAALAQLRQGQDAAVANQMALSRSGRGGANAGAARQAMANAAGIQQQGNSAAAQLRAQEEASWRQQQLAALQGASGARGTLGSQQVNALQSAQQGYAGMSASQLAALQGAAQTQGGVIDARTAELARQAGALGSAQDAYSSQAALRGTSAGTAANAGAAYMGQNLAAVSGQVGATQSQTQLNDAMRLGLNANAYQQGQLAQGYLQTGQEGALGFTNAEQMARQNAQANSNAAVAGRAAAANAANTSLYNYAEGNRQGTQAYETQQGNLDIAAQTANQTADTQRDAANVGAIGSGVAAVAGWMGMSDIRSKTDIRAEPSAGVSALEALAEAPGYGYDYKRSARERYGVPAGRQWGPMAQDLESTDVGRTAVKRGEDGMRRIDTGRLAMINASATAELAKRMERLEKLAGGREARA